MAFPRRHRPTIGEQAFPLSNRFPGSTIKVRANAFVWEGALRPTSTSHCYRVRISYARGDWPQVRVLSPTLDTRLGERLPHVFREGTLCLHTEDDWRPSMLLADTILPWTCEWLFYYELWLATGAWYGNEESIAPEVAVDEIAEVRRGRNVAGDDQFTEPKRFRHLPEETTSRAAS